MTTDACDIEQRLRLIDELDLEPIAFKLVHPEPGRMGMSVQEADERIIKYRRFLKLCVMYPERSIVPAQEFDEVWHAHILDTAKYADDCNRVFGYFLHHFPYLGLRGEEDVAQWQQSFADTKALYEQHFGEPMFSASAACDGGDGTGGSDGGGLCDGGACDSSACSPPAAMLTRERPQLVRA